MRLSSQSDWDAPDITVRQRLCWAYANVAMSSAAVDRKLIKYDRLCFVIRSKLYKGLLDGTMKRASLFKDEQLKLHQDRRCSYCTSTTSLSVDHVIPRNLGGKDTGDNLILACKSCNSSKKDIDLLEWINYKRIVVPVATMRRYLKLVWDYCEDNTLMDFSINQIKQLSLPFNIQILPVTAPKPFKLLTA